MRPLVFHDGRGYTRAELAGADDAPVFVAEPSLATVARVLSHIRHRRPFVPLRPRLTPDERASLRAGVAARDIPPGTLAVVFTSGTTGRPRGALLPRAAFVAAATASAARLGWHDDDRWLVCLPLAHVGGLSILVRCLLARRPVILGAPDRIAADVVRHRATLVSLVPTLLARLLDAGWQPPPHLRAVLLGGAPASPALLRRAAERGVPVLTTYGLTEACSQVATQRSPADPGCGPPLPGVALRIVDDQIEIDGPTLFSGYLGEPPRVPGWFSTGDFGRLDAGGNLHVLGRRTDLIVSGGENVYPAEVEAHLEAAGVTACVFGVADDTWGEVVAAAVVGTRLDPTVLAALAPFKRPRRVAYVSALPLNAAGKPDRAAARAAARRVGLVPIR